MIKRRVLLRPVCWAKGHDGQMIRGAMCVPEEAPKPPATFCARCGMSPAPLKAVTS